MKQISRLYECYVCGNGEIGIFGTLPLGWAILWEPSKLLCDNCLYEWEYRFHEKPAIWISGGEKEVILFDEWM